MPSYTPTRPRGPLIDDQGLAPARVPQVFTPSQLNREVRALLESGLGLIVLEGEISNFTRAGSGHLYFTLKDATAQVRCAMFRQRALMLRIRPAEGMQVRIRARVSLYEPRGEFQLIAEHMEDAGVGRLQRELEALKARLQAEGLFEPARKRELPRSPRHLALITSPTGAAIRDVISVISRRWPLLRVTLYPSLVQGESAAGELLRALRAASSSGQHDVILLTRGGGSLEDLWAFNDEQLVRAIAASAVPVVSAVGHETDFSLSDFAADMRAPTPSAAAELITPDGASLLQALGAAHRRLARACARRLELSAQRLDIAQRRLHAQQPQRRLQQMAEQLQRLSARLHRRSDTLLAEASRNLHSLQIRLQGQHPHRQLKQRREQLRRLRTALYRGMDWRMLGTRQRLQQQAQALQAISPLRTLQRGYAVVRRGDSSGPVLSDAGLLKPGVSVKVDLAKGAFSAQVTEVDQPPQ